VLEIKIIIKVFFDNIFEDNILIAVDVVLKGE
jgi:hypothetical protein